MRVAAIGLQAVTSRLEFTFAQALTETAAAVDNVVVLVSIPESSIEVGGARGQQAMEMLKNVVDAQGQAVAAGVPG